jgi:L-asparaginase / beta-aspartyl-peptidase
MPKMIVLTNGEGEVGMSVAVEMLRAKESGLKIVEEGIKQVELTPLVKCVGVGGAPNLLGQVECDAAIMNGLTLECGSVGALQGYIHAIVVAKAVMEKLPHVFLVGKGAAQFAREIGEKTANLLTEEAFADYSSWVKKNIPENILENKDLPLLPYANLSAKGNLAKGTTVFLVRDINGNLAGGTSTSGWAYKYPGRLGDSPIIGAGLYVDNRYGGAACTHTGEMTVRAGTARAIVAYMKKGATVEEACHEAIDDLVALKGGFLGAVVIHAIDAEGNPYVLSTDNNSTICYWVWTDTSLKIEQKKPIFVDFN